MSLKFYPTLFVKRVLILLLFLITFESQVFGKLTQAQIDMNQNKTNQNDMNQNNIKNKNESHKKSKNHSQKKIKTEAKGIFRINSTPFDLNQTHRPHLSRYVKEILNPKKETKKKK